jgi:hypothetical protein
MIIEIMNMNKEDATKAIGSLPSDLYNRESIAIYLEREVLPFL